MAYTSKNFKTKKALKEALAAGEKISVFHPGIGRPIVDGEIIDLEGPHSPAPHTWYASCKTKGGYIIPGSVK